MSNRLYKLVTDFNFVPIGVVAKLISPTYSFCSREIPWNIYSPYQDNGSNS